MVYLFNKLLSKTFIICVIFISIGIFFSRSAFLFTFYYLYCFTCIAVTFYLRKKLYGTHIILRMLFVMLISFFIRAMAIYFLNLTQQGDYANYLSIAHKINVNILDNTFY